MALLKGDVPRSIAFGFAYFCLAALCLTYTRFEGGVALIWLSGSLLTARLLVILPTRWPAFIATSLIASAAATSIFGLGGGAPIPFAIINVGESLLAAWLIRRFVTDYHGFQSLEQTGKFLLIGGVAAPMASGLFGAWVASSVGGVDFWMNWLNWTMGHGLGAITFGPIFILVIASWRVLLPSLDYRPKYGEALILVTITAATCVGTFSQSQMPLLFLPLLPTMIAVFRIGRAGAALSIIVITIIGTTFTLKGLGPISLMPGSSGLKAQFFQLYLAVTVLTALPAAGDLKKRKNDALKLAEANALQNLILDRTGDIIMSLEVDGTIRFVSPSISNIGGFTPDALVGRTAHEMVHEDDIPDVIATHRRALREPDATFLVEYRASRENGELAWFETHTRAYVDNNGQPSGVINIIREVSRRKSIEADLLRQAETDVLTGLRNRRAFEAALNKMVATLVVGDKQGYLAIFDLDHFKAINDSFGHAVGDKVIQAFAEILNSASRDQDVVARLGGEEFVALFTDTNIGQATEICERIRTRFAKVTVVTDANISVKATVSAGLAAINAGASGKTILQNADVALYHAKAAGRNRVELAA